MSKRWTIKSIEETPDILFAKHILMERAVNLNMHSPLAQKLKCAVRTLGALEFIAEAERERRVYLLPYPEGATVYVQVPGMCDEKVNSKCYQRCGGFDFSCSEYRAYPDVIEVKYSLEWFGKTVYPTEVDAIAAIYEGVRNAKI